MRAPNKLRICTPVLVVATALLLPLSAPAGAADGGRPGDSDVAIDSALAPGGPASESSGDDRRPGHIEEGENGSFHGEYVAFEILRETTCSVQRYAVFNVAFFETIQLAGRCEDEEQRGAQFRLEGENADLRIHDSPNGLIRFEADDDTEIALRLAPGVSIVPDGQGLQLRTTGLQGRLFLVGDVRWENGTMLLGDTTGTFLVEPPGPPSETRAAFLDAIGARRVGAQVDIVLDGDAVTTEVFPFDDVFVRAEPSHRGPFRVLVDSDLPEGRVFLVNFPVGLLQEGDVSVAYFDFDRANFPVAVGIEPADDLADVLAIQGGEGPEYWWVEDADGKHVFVAVPHFSLHAFEIGGFRLEPPPPIGYGTVAGLGFVAVAAWVMFASRRRAPQ